MKYQGYMICECKYYSTIKVIWKHQALLTVSNIPLEVGNSCEKKEELDILSGFPKYLVMKRESYIFTTVIFTSLGNTAFLVV